jgi:sterol desaturase/sphingolipid hydroxylase (fatty acid hydroxylase superfamily)
MGSGNYWLTFVADSSTAAFFFVWDLTHGIHPAAAAILAVGGFLLWGFTEYAFHRWVYHQPDGIFGDGHRIHHVDAEALIAMPWFITTATMFTLWYVAGRFGELHGFGSLAAGWLAGFVWYSLVHHSHHHWDIRFGWARRLKAYHRVHHQFPDRNYGVTLRIWDAVFGTRYRRQEPRPTEAAAVSATAQGN